MQMIEVSKLKFHPRNNEFFDDIYGDKWEDFKKSIARRGIVEAVVATQDLITVSGHQRIRAAKEIGILEVPCRITHYPDVDEATGNKKEDLILEDLICTNIMQRGIGNVNPMKMARCIYELERIYGIKNGGDRKSDGNNFVLNTQSNLATQIGIDQRQLQNYKKLNNLIPELQFLVENEGLKATTAYKIWAKMPIEEQEVFFNKIGKDKIKQMTQKETQKYIEEKQQLEQSNKILQESYNELSHELQQEKNKKPKTVEVKIDKPETLQKIKLLEEREEKIKQEKEGYINKYKKTLIDLKEEQSKVSKFMGDSTNFELVSSTSELTLKMINFTKEMSKYDYLSETFNDIPDATRKEYVRSIYGVYKWARNVLNVVKVDDVLGINKNNIENIEYTEVND